MPDPRLDGIVNDLLVEDDSGRSLPERLCAAAVAALPVTAAALTLSNADGAAQVVVAATDDRARHLEELEFTLGEGPAVDASHDGGPVLVPDLLDRGRTSRWPAYRPEATASTTRSQFSFPLQIGAIRLGVLTLYRDQAGMLSEADLARALTFADAATLVLLHLQDVSDTGDGNLPRELGTQFDMTAELHQATGMVSVQAAVGMAEALLLLRGRAFGSSLSPVAVAREVLAGTLNFRNQGDHDGREPNDGGVSP